MRTLSLEQVRGFCIDLSNEDLFERVNVRGDIRFSDIHHNHFGMCVCKYAPMEFQRSDEKCHQCSIFNLT